MLIKLTSINARYTKTKRKNLIERISIYDLKPTRYQLKLHLIN